MRLLPTAATLVAAATVLLAAAPAAPAGADPAGGPVDGVWRTDGYGMIIAISGGRGEVYQTTGISCLLAQTADQIGPVRRGGVVDFGADGVVGASAWRTGRDRARLHSWGAAGDIGLVRLPALPARCARPTPTDPLTSFDIFWTTYAENYPFFAAKHVDWQAVRDRYRPLVTADTTQQQLFQIFVDMIAPLGDAHTSVGTDRAHQFGGQRPGTRAGSPEFEARTEAAIVAHLGVTPQTWGGGEIAYADLPGQLGYLRIGSFGDYVPGGDGSYAEDRAELDRALDAVFTAQRAGDLRGLIVDVRYNPGGDDALGLAVAARLTGRPYLAYAKRARNDPADPTRHTALQRIAVRPDRHAPAYTGPVALLTSDLTASAGETFTQALMGRTPAPTRIGLPTQGVFSDVLKRLLPDGFRFELPNEEFLTRDGRTFDGPGIPPDVLTPVFTDAELAANQDSAIDAARALLTAGR
ncbi:MAG: S41 family peptidase [Mycobacteriales bacterium]